MKGTGSGNGPDMNGVVLETAELLKDNKAQDILVLNLQGHTSITDYFIICTVTSSVQTRALVRDVEEFMDRHDIKPFSKAVQTDSPWVLLDYNHFVIHIFLREGREFYGLEKLWSDAEVLYSHRGDIL
jgi:ribosome-associated protein